MGEGLNVRHGFYGVAILCNLLLFSSISHAIDGTITFSGTLGGECTVGNYTESVDFGRVLSSNLTAAGSETDASNFSIGITCSDTDTLPYLTFEGEVDENYGWGFANTGSAEGVAARLIFNGATIVPGSSTALTVPTTPGQETVYSFGARIRRTADLTYGNIEIPVTFTLSYE